MIGARHSAGSTISNGGECSPSNWVILGRRPWNPLTWTHHFGQKNGGFCPSALSGVATDLPSEKSPKSGGTLLNPQIALPIIPVQKWLTRRLRDSLFHPKFTLCRA